MVHQDIADTKIKSCLLCGVRLWVPHFPNRVCPLCIGVRVEKHLIKCHTCGQDLQEES